MISLPPGFYDPETHILTGPLGQRRLPRSMHHIMLALAAAHGRAVTHGAMIEQLWPPPLEAPARAANVVRVQVARIRRRMQEVGIDRRTIGTRHQIGYFLAPLRVMPGSAEMSE